MQAGALVVRLRPIIPAWLFDENNEVRFTFLGKIPVIYHNPGGVDTWKALPQKIALELTDGSDPQFSSSDIPAPYAEMVRERNVKLIKISF